MWGALTLLDSGALVHRGQNTSPLLWELAVKLWRERLCLDRRKHFLCEGYVSWESALTTGAVELPALGIA